MKTITFPSGSYYVSKRKEIVDTLFTRGGTASGYYKKLKRGICFYNMQDEPFLQLIANKHNEYFFVTCYLFNGRKRYMYGVSSTTEKQLGLDTLSFMGSSNFAKEIWGNV